MIFDEIDAAPAGGGVSLTLSPTRKW